MAGLGKRSGLVLVVVLALLAIGDSDARQWVPDHDPATPAGFLPGWPIESFPDSSNDSGFDRRPKDNSSDSWLMPIGTEEAEATPDVTPTPALAVLAN
jgi:hypothetical protein